MSDEELHDVLKAQSHRLRSLEDQLDEADPDLAELKRLTEQADSMLEQRGETVDRPDPAAKAAPNESKLDPRTWDEIVADNRSWLTEAGLEDSSLDDLLTTAEINQLESFSALGRERWAASDFMTVGGCAVIGVLATIFDDQIDSLVKSGLGGLKDTNVMKGWEASGKNLSLDYTGEHFGGPGHRVRSAGHDIGRPWEALSQIRQGEFRGVYWDHGDMAGFASKLNPQGKVYIPHGPGEALVLWLKHLGADLVTETSLPLPWWSILYEMPYRDMRKLAHDLYNPSGGGGLNMRSVFVSKTLPVLTTELIVGVKVHTDAYRLEGQVAGLSGNQRLRKQEMLLAGHGATGLASIGKTAVLAAGGEHVVALRHLNPIALGRIGYLGLKIALEYRKRAKDRRVPSWDDILQSSPLPWQLAGLEGIA